MIDYQKAREAALKEIANLTAFEEYTHPHVARILDVTLSAFEAHGLVLVPKVATIGMIGAMADANAKHGGMATPAQEYEAMVGAALQERQKK